MSEFDKIIGYTQIKKELEQISDTLKNYEYYKKFGVLPPRGIMLYGRPGVGKTLMANCLIQDTGRKAFVCRKDEPNGKFVETIKKTFEDAKNNAPSIVFLDDMDKFANEDEEHRNAEEYVTIQSCIDGLKGMEVYVIATVNDRRNLPSSLKRAGRFDRMLEVRCPTGKDAEQIAEHYMKNKKMDADIQPEIIAHMLEGYSCAVLETVINEAAIYAGYERCETISMRHFAKAWMHVVRRTMLLEENNLENIDINVRSRYTEVVYHEAGHAVMADILRQGQVAFIGLSEEDGVIGGSAKNYHPYDNSSTDREPEEEILIGLAGKAATENKWGIIDGGSRYDLMDAFYQIKAMTDEMCLYGFQYFESREPYSEELMAKREQVIAVEMERYYQKAKRILIQNQEFVNKVAHELAEKKFLTDADMKRIRESCHIITLNSLV